MFREIISEDNMLIMAGTSEGSQVKYKKGEFWYKLDKQGKEGYTEYLASQLLSFSDLLPEEYIRYEYGTVNGRPGCRSRNFLKNEEELITFYRLYYNESGQDLSQVLAGMDSMKERIDYTLHFIRESSGVDVTDYLRKIFTLDRIILNEDRHLNNLALISNGNCFRPAPIFDNGVSLLTANKSFRPSFPLSENVGRVVARPFSGSHESMYRHFGAGFRLDCKKLYEWLGSEPESREKSVLLYQLKQLSSDLASNPS